MTQQGYIYKIVSKQTDKYYVGSTTHPLSVRLYYHYKNKDKSNITSKQILQYEDATIELIEIVSFDNVCELREKEKEYIINHKEECVNERGIYKDKKEMAQVWRDKNREKLRESYKRNRAKYREANPLPPRKTEEEKKEYKKQYHIEHAKEKSEYDKLYREKNKDKLCQEIICECGGKYKLRHKSTHLKTKLHQDFSSH
jgi:hypothetical protein